MTDTFIPTLSRNPLYCVWIETGNPSHPLERVWIDPELRSFVDVKTAAPIRAATDESQPETPAEPFPGKGLFAERMFVTPLRREEMKVKACLTVGFHGLWLCFGSCSTPIGPTWREESRGDLP